MSLRGIHRVWKQGRGARRVIAAGGLVLVAGIRANSLADSTSEPPRQLPAAAAPSPSPRGVRIASLGPPSGGAVVGRRPTLKISLSPDAPELKAGQLLVTLDGDDVTALLELTDRQVTLRLPLALKPGQHVATLRFVDDTGQPGEPVTWNFEVRDYQALQEGSLDTKLSGTYELAPDRLNRHTDPKWKASANLGVQGRVAEGDFEAKGESSFRYVDQDRATPAGSTSRQIDMANGLVTLGYRDNRVEAGDVAISESWLTTGDSFARRGLKLKGLFAGTEVHLFAARVQPVIGLIHLSGVEDADDRVTGVSISRPLIGDDTLRLKLTVLDGQTTNPAGFNVGSAEPGAKATTYSALLSSKLPHGLTGELEFARSWSRVAALDELSWKSNDAWRLKLASQIGERVKLTGLYSRIGRDFASLANPTIVRDREGPSLEANATFGPTSWKLSVARTFDNVENRHLLPRLVEWLGGATLGLTLPDYPILTLTYSRSDQHTERRAEGVARKELVTDTLALALSLNRGKWNVALSPSYSYQNPRDANADSDNFALSLTMGFTPVTWLTVSPSYTWNRQANLGTHLVTSTHTPTLTTKAQLLPEVLSIDTQTTYTATADNQRTAHNQNLSALLRISWSLKRLLGGGDFEPVLSTRLNYNRNRDAVTRSGKEEFGVFLVVDIGASLQVLPMTWLDRFRQTDDPRVTRIADRASAARW